MALGTTYATLPTGNNAASLLDTSFSQVGAMGVTACTATGTNTILLTQKANQPTISAYNNYLLFSFVAAANSTGSVNINVNNISALPLYLSDGVTAAASGSISINVLYLIVYNLALNSGAGGFQLVTSSGAPLASPAFTGTPTAPTATSTTNTTQLATTAFVQALLTGSTTGGETTVTSSGFIIKFGIVTGTTTSPVTQTVNFQTAFPTACSGVVTAPSVTTGGGDVSYATVSSVSSSQFQTLARCNRYYIAWGN